MIYGISHITFIVKDLDKATKFFKEIFEAKEIYSSEDKKFSISKEKFFLINDLWIAVMEGEEMEKSYNHIAFKIDESDYEMYLKRIENLGLEIKAGRKRVIGEGIQYIFMTMIIIFSNSTLEHWKQDFFATKKNQQIKFNSN